MRAATETSKFLNLNLNIINRRQMAEILLIRQYPQSIDLSINQSINQSINHQPIDPLCWIWKSQTVETVIFK